MSALVATRFRFTPVLMGTVITVLLLWMFGQTAEVFLLLFMAVLISLYLGAVTDLLENRTRLPRKAAFLIALLGTLAAVIGLGWLIIPPVAVQTQSLLRVLPDDLVRWQTGIEKFIARVPALRAVWPAGENRILIAVYEQLSGYARDLVPKLFSLVNVAISVFSVVVMAIYLALQPGLYRELLIALFPPVHRDLVRNVLADLARALRAWIVGQLLAMLFLGSVTAVALYFLGVPYWLTFGVFTGVVAIVPFFGTLLSTALPAMFVLGTDGNPTRAVLVILVGVGVHLLEGNVVGPLIMQKQVHLPPVLTIMSVLIMGKLIGSLGLLVALPTLAVVLVVVRRILISRIYEGQGFRKTVRDTAFLVRAPLPEGGIILSDVDPPDILAIAELERQRVA